MNNLKIVPTKDLSNTLYSEQFKEHYHSINGAVSESMHIFINLGLKKFENRTLNILEIGYGTGLNAILSYLENKQLRNTIYYEAIDVVCPNKEIFENMGYADRLGVSFAELSHFYENWNLKVCIDNNFSLLKNKIDFKDFTPSGTYDLIYFDAFSPEVQPEMWEYENLKKIILKLDKGGVFVTYCSKGIVKRTLRSCGLEVKRVAGPLGKRHVIYAIKN